MTTSANNSIVLKFTKDIVETERTPQIIPSENTRSDKAASLTRLIFFFIRQLTTFRNSGGIVRLKTRAGYPSINVMSNIRIEKYATIHVSVEGFIDY
jgi:hypothetical protein